MQASRFFEKADPFPDLGPFGLLFEAQIPGELDRDGVFDGHRMASRQ